MLGSELIHAPTLEPHPTPDLIIPGNCTEAFRQPPLASVSVPRDRLAPERWLV